MNDNRTIVIIERVFSEKGKTLEETYMSYMAKKITDMVKSMDNASITEKVNSEKQ